MFSVTLSLSTMALSAPGIGPVVAHLEVLTIDLGGGRESGPRPAVGVRRESIHLQLQGDRLGHAANREVAVDQEPVTGRDARPASGT